MAYHNSVDADVGSSQARLLQKTGDSSTSSVGYGTSGPAGHRRPTLDTAHLPEPEPDSDDPDQLPTTTTMASSSKRLLAVAYAGLFLLAFTTSLEGQVTAPLAAFAVSSFHNHSLLSTVYVVQGVVNAVIKPPMAKMADVFGRFEAFVAAVTLCVTGYVQMACSQSVQTFSAAQILYSAGITGLQVLQQILVADTSDLRHRALMSSLPDTPFLVTVWVGPAIAAAVLAHSSWRWGYAMWAFILPVAFCPLAISLAINAHQTKLRRSRRRSCFGLVQPKTPTACSAPVTPITPITPLSTAAAIAAIGPLPPPPSPPPPKSRSAAFRHLLADLDAGGMLLLSAALSLILLPLTLAAKVEGGWANPGILISIVVGILLLALAFPAWESRPHLAPHPIIPPSLLHNVTFCAGCGMALFWFAVFYLSVQPYFYSYLLVAHNQTVAGAGRITQIFSFTSTIAAVSASIGIRHVRRYKPFVVTGAVVLLVGEICMRRYRTIDAGTVRLVLIQVAVGAGTGLMSVPTQLGIQASVTRTPHLISAATAVFLTMGEVGIALGSAISGALWGRLVPAKLDAYLPEAARQNASAIYSSVAVAISYPWGSPERIAIIRAYQEAMTTLLTVAVIFCVPVLLLALLMENIHLDSKHLHADDSNGNNANNGSGSGSGSGSENTEEEEESATTTSRRRGTPTAYTVNDFVGSTSVGERTILLDDATDSDTDGPDTNSG